MKKYVTVTEACNYLLRNTVKGVSYNSETSKMTITYNNGAELVTETFTVGGGDTTELEEAIEQLQEDVGDLQNDKQDTLTAGDGIDITSNVISVDNTVALKTDLDDKQDTLVSGTNIKTVNNQSLLGSGNITISGGASPSNLKTRTCEMTYTQNDDVLMFNISYDSGTYDLIGDSGNILTIINGMKMLGKKIRNGTVTDVLIKFDKNENEFYTYNLTSPNTIVDTYNYNLAFVRVVQ